MKIQWLGQTAKQQEALTLFPSCYSQEFHNCITANSKAEGNRSGFPNCVRLLELYPPGSNDVFLNTKIQAMPYCSPPKQTSMLPYIVLAVGVIVAGGVYFR